MRGLPILLVAAACVVAAPASSQTQEPPTPAQPSLPGPPMQRGTAALTGRVADRAGAPLGGVAVKVFEEGLLLEEAQSAPDGTYRLEFPYLPDIDWTVVVWYVPAEGDLVPEILILRESLRSKSLDLWSTCLPRVDLRGEMRYDATLVDGKTKQQMISELDCFKRQTQ